MYSNNISISKSIYQTILVIVHSIRRTSGKAIVPDFTMELMSEGPES